MDIFLAHLKSHTDEDLVEPIAALKALSRPNDTITLAREDYLARFKSAGSLWSWTTSIAARYDAVVVVPGPSGGTGSITAQIVQRMREKGKAVWQWLKPVNGQESFGPVAGVQNVDPKNRKEGWKCY